MAEEPKDIHEDPALAGLDDDLFDFDELDQPVEPQGVSFGRTPEPGPPAIARGPEPASGPARPVATHADGADFSPLDEAALDHDLFDFDELFLGEAPQPTATPAAPAPAPRATPTPEPAAAAVEPVADLDPLEDEAPAPEQPSEPVAHEDDWDAFDLATPEPAAASASEDRLDPALLRAAAPARPPVPPASTARAEVDPHTPPAPLDVEDAPRRGRLVELLVLCFLLVNTSLVVLAWRAGDDFRATLSEVSQGLAGATVEARGHDTRASVPAHLPEPVVQEPVEPVEVPDLTRTALDLAREDLEAGRFEDARRGLYRLLANQDRAALTADQVGEAEVLIARSYHLQGRAVREEGSR